MQDTPLELGGLAVCQGSHELPGFRRLHETYGNLDVERDGLDGTGECAGYSSVPLAAAGRVSGRETISVRCFHLALCRLVY